MKDTPTIEQIEAQIEALKKIKPTVRKTSAFGDNHHNAIEAQIETLQDDLDEEEIERRCDDGDWMENEKEVALQARQWLDGEYEGINEGEDLVEGWKSLVIK